MNEPPPRRRWLRISLRMVLVLTTILSVGLGLLVNYIHKRQSAFTAIREAGGLIRMDHTQPTRWERWFGQSEVFGHVSRVNLRLGKEKVDNKLLAHLANLPEMTHLDLSYAYIDDEGVRQLAELPLVELWLQGTRITDESAETISRFKSLEVLALRATRLSDKFLQDLEPLSELEALGMGGTDVTDIGMSYLARHPKLEELDLNKTKVGDAGVKELLTCPALVGLDLANTKVTDATLEYLGQMPELKRVVLWDTYPGVKTYPGMTRLKLMDFELQHPNITVE